MYFRAIFTSVSKVICVYFGFGSDWLKKLAPISQPIRSATKTNRGVSFPALCVIALSLDWTMDCSASFMIG